MSDDIDCLRHEPIPKLRSTLSSDTSSSSSTGASRQSPTFSRLKTSTIVVSPDRPTPAVRSQSYEVVPLSLKQPLRHSRSADALSIIPREAAALTRRPKLTCKDLPDEILHGILKHLRNLYPRERYQHTLNDLSSLSRTNVQWHEVTGRHIYHTLWISANNLHAQPRRFFIKPKTRLDLIRRTLRQHPNLAAYVRDIRIVNYPAPSKTGSKDLKTYCQSLASLISTCPQFERLTGFYPTYHEKYDSLFHAISAKRMLKEHTWILCAREKPKTKERRSWRSSSSQVAQKSSPDIAFAELHSRFEHLETLAISCLADGGSNQNISLIFEHLPALQHLHLSSLASQDFNTSHLKFLPRKLASLRLESLPGVGENGLMEYFSLVLPLDERKHLQSLSLVDMNIHSLLSINIILDHLYNLRRLVLVTTRLSLSHQDEPEEFLHPFISSRSLRFLHWDIGSAASLLDVDGDCDSDKIDHDAKAMYTNALLAESILADGFPELEFLSAPLDPTGLIQSVCKPLARPVVRAVTAAAGPYFKPYYDSNSPPPTPLIHRATSGKGFASDKTAETHNSSRKQTPAVSAYHRAAEALHARRRLGRDLVAGFKFDLIEELEPYMTIFVHNAKNQLEAVLEFPQFMGRLGSHVPEYIVHDDGDPGNGIKTTNGVVGLKDVIESGGGLGIERLFG